MLHGTCSDFKLSSDSVRVANFYRNNGFIMENKVVYKTKMLENIRFALTTPYDAYNISVKNIYEYLNTFASYGTSSLYLAYKLTYIYIFIYTRTRIR